MTDTLDPVLRLPRRCDLADALDLVREAVHDHDPGRHWLVIAAGTKLRNVPENVTVNGKWTTRYVTRTTKPGDRLYGVPFVDESEAEARRAEYKRHVELMRVTGPFVASFGH